jgi:tRNA/tmRNA/rRNA uracil-C5-methylase (TrmA/RlmC/RlmD family)
MVYGVDIEEKAIAKAMENKKKENISNVEFVLSSGELKMNPDVTPCRGSLDVSV